MSDHYDRYNGMENLLGTNLASLGTDCISRQAAIDAVAKGLKGVFVEYQDVAEKLLNNVPSVQPQRWIPVSEALPEPNEVGDDGFVKAYLVQAGRTIHTARYDGEYWVLWTYSRVLDNVVAWMPLPEPMREKG